MFVGGDPEISTVWQLCIFIYWQCGDVYVLSENISLLAVLITNRAKLALGKSRYQSEIFNDKCLITEQPDKWILQCQCQWHMLLNTLKCEIACSYTLLYSVCTEEKSIVIFLFCIIKLAEKKINHWSLKTEKCNQCETAKKCDFSPWDLPTYFSDLHLAHTNYAAC